MADVQIVAGGASAAPLAYTVPGAQEIVVKALFATFDGTAAGGAFLPCIRVVAPGGIVVGEYITDASVAAGSSAEVSFAPFLRGAASGSSATPAAWAVVSRTLTQGTLSGTTATLVWNSFSTSNTAIFSTSPNNTTGDTALAFSTAGIYLLTSSATWLAVLANTRNIRMVNTGTAQLVGFGSSLANTFPINNAAYTFASTHVDTQMIALNSTSAATTVKLNAIQNSGLGQTIGSGATIAAYYWPSTDGAVVY